METGFLNTYNMDQTIFDRHKSVDNSYSELTDDSACHSTCNSTSPDTQERDYKKLRTSTICEDRQSVERYVQVESDKWDIQSDISSVKEDSDTEFSDDADYEEVHSEGMNDPEIERLSHNHIQIDEVCFDFDSSIQIITVNPDACLDSSYESDTSESLKTSHFSRESSVIVNDTQGNINTCSERLLNSSKPKSVMREIHHKINKKTAKRKRKKSSVSISPTASDSISSISDPMKASTDIQLDLDNYISDLNNLHIKNNDIGDEHSSYSVQSLASVNRDLSLLGFIKCEPGDSQIEAKFDNLDAITVNMQNIPSDLLDSTITYDDMDLECPVEGKIDDSSTAEEVNFLQSDVADVVKSNFGASLLDFCLEKQSDDKNNGEQPQKDMESSVLSVSCSNISGLNNKPKLNRDTAMDIFNKMNISYDHDEFVDIESFTDADAVPVLEAHNLHSLLEQFEETEKFNLLDSFDNPDKPNFNVDNYVNYAKVESGAPQQSSLLGNTETSMQTWKTKVQQLVSLAPGSSSANNLNSSSESIQLDHDYCSPSKRKFSKSLTQVKSRNPSQNALTCDTQVSTSSESNSSTVEDTFSPVHPDLLKLVAPYYILQSGQTGLGKGKCISNITSEVIIDKMKADADETASVNVSCLINKSNHRKKDLKNLNVSRTRGDSTSSDHCYTKPNPKHDLFGDEEDPTIKNIESSCDIIIKIENDGAADEEASLNNSPSNEIINISVNKQLTFSQCDKPINCRNAKSLLKTSLLLPIEGDCSLRDKNTCLKGKILTNSSPAKQSPRKGNQISLLKSSYVNDSKSALLTRNIPRMDSNIHITENATQTQAPLCAELSLNNNLPRKRKLNLQEYKLRREGKSNDSSRTNSPVTVMTIDNQAFIKTEASSTMSSYPDITMTDMLKNDLDEKDTTRKFSADQTSASIEVSVKTEVDAKPDVMRKELEKLDPREATRLILKKRRVAALRKTEDKIVLSKIPKVDTVQILPLTVDGSDVGASVDSSPVTKENLGFRIKSSDYEEIVMVSIGNNTEPVETLELPLQDDPPVTVNANKERTDKNKSSAVNFKIAKKKVLNRNPLFEINSDAEDDLVKEKVFKNGLLKSGSIDLQQTISDKFATEMSHIQIIGGDSTWNCTQNKNVGSQLSVGNTPNIKMETNELANKTFFGGCVMSSIIEITSDCADHGEDKVIMHLKKDREKPVMVSAEVQADEDKLFIPLSALWSYSKNLVCNVSTKKKCKIENMDTMEARKDDDRFTNNDPSKNGLMNDDIEKQMTVEKRQRRSGNDKIISSSHSDKSNHDRLNSRDRSSGIKYSRRSRSYERRSRYRSRERRRNYHSRSRNTSSTSPPSKVHKIRERTRDSKVVPNKNYRRNGQYRDNGSCRSRSDSSDSMMGSLSSRISYSSVRSHNAKESGRRSRRRSRSSKPRSRSISSSTLSQSPSASSYSSRSCSSRSSSSTTSRRSRRSRRSRNSGRSHQSGRKRLSRDRRHSNRGRDHRSRTRARSSFDESEAERPVEERRIVFVGRLEKDITKLALRRAFDQFGPIKEVTLHSKEDGSRYGFLTFSHANDAWIAVGEAHRVSTLCNYDVSFGGRRAFCRRKYADLDNIEMDQEDENLHGHFAPSMPHADEFSFDRLLNEMKRTLTKRKVTSGNRRRHQD